MIPYFIISLYKNIIEPVAAFIKKLPPPDSICFGVAGPVMNGHVKFSNIQWEIDRSELSVYFKNSNVELINDLEATGYGLAVLGEEDIKVIHSGSRAPATSRASSGRVTSTTCKPSFAVTNR